MSELAETWVQLVVCAMVIGVAGTALTRHADVIAWKTGLSGAWIGLVLLATVTSLPELTTGVSAVSLANAPDVAVGNVLGACVLNLAYVALLDILKRDAPVFARASPTQIGLAGFGVVMLALVALALALSGYPLPLTMGFVGMAHVGLVAPALLILYLVAVSIVFGLERAPMAGTAGPAALRYPGLSLRQAVVRSLLAAVCVVAAGAWLPWIATDLARLLGWSDSFVGTLLVSGVTSLPELVVTLSALRIGAIDMAIANLLGSNLSNLLILGVDDLFYRTGPLLAAVAPVHSVSVASALLMSGVVVVALLTRPTGRVLRLASWASLALGCIYLLNAYVLFRHGS